MTFTIIDGSGPLISRKTSIECFLSADLAKVRGWLEADNPYWLS